MVPELDSRQQQVARTCSDNKWQHILVQVLVIVCLDPFHLVLLAAMLRLFEDCHMSLENTVQPVNSSVTLLCRTVNQYD